MGVSSSGKTTVAKQLQGQSLEVVIQRENARKDRKIGIAEEAYHRFYQGKEFDLIFDTNEIKPEDVAKEILSKMDEKTYTLKC